MYAPELNKVFCNGRDISRMFANTVLLGLCNDYEYNVKLVRKAAKPNVFLRMWKLVATRPNGTTETRFCHQTDINGILRNFKQAQRYYSIEGTQLDFKPYFRY